MVTGPYALARVVRSASRLRPAVLVALLFLAQLGASCTNLNTAAPLKLARIAYIHEGDVERGLDFGDFLVHDQGAVVTLIALNEVASTDFSQYDAIIIGPETGGNFVSGWEWFDTSGATAEYIEASGVPVLGLGSGGALYFELASGHEMRYGRLGHGRVGPATVEVVDASHEVWSTPNDLRVANGQQVTLYEGSWQEAALYNKGASSIAFIGKSQFEADPGEPYAYYSLAEERGSWYWAWEGGPSAMTEQGRKLFVNILAQMVVPKSVYSLYVPGLAKSDDVVQETPTPTPFAAVSAGQAHTCGLRADGTIDCWGRNDEGQASAPYGTFKAVATGVYYSCGLRVSGSVQCWGQGSVAQASPPAEPLGAIFGGTFHVCGLREDGSAVCWGENSHGQASPPPGPFRSLAPGNRYTCGLRLSGVVECWGQEVGPPGTFKAYAAGWNLRCGILTDGTVTCSGVVDKVGGKPTPPRGTFSAITAGTIHACGIRTDGTVACWGDNEEGEAAPPAGRFAVIAAGSWHTCGVRLSGAIECWGANAAGQSQPPP